MKGTLHAARLGGWTVLRLSWAKRRSGRVWLRRAYRAGRRSLVTRAVKGQGREGVQRAEGAEMVLIVDMGEARG
jgi:hypothetical protein